MKNNKFVFLMASVVCSVLVASAPAAEAQSWTPSGPISRLFHSAVLDTSTNQMIVFGGVACHRTIQETSCGLSAPQPIFNDVWWLSGVGSSDLAWTQAAPTGSPPPARVGHTAVYDAASNRMIVFGGGTGQTYPFPPCQNDVWVLTNANGVGDPKAWSQIAAASTYLPEPRSGHTAVYDPTSNQMTIFGGQIVINTFKSKEDVWVLSNANGLAGPARPNRSGEAPYLPIPGLHPGR